MDGVRFFNRCAAVVVVAAVFVALESCEGGLLSTVQDDVKQATTAKTAAIELYYGGTRISSGNSLDVGGQPTGSDFNIALTIKNTGNGDLLLSGNPTVVPSSTTAGFSIFSLPNSTVAAGSSANLVLRFHPAAGTGYNAAVTIASNASNEPSLSFSITGTGIAPDTTAPTGSIAIQGGAAFTQTTTVNLVLSASDTGGGSVQEMQIGNDAGFTGNSWEPYATMRVWTVTSGDGLKTIYARFKDTSGNISSPYSVTITLDTVNPTIQSRNPINGQTNFTRTSNIVVTFSESIDPSTITSSTVSLKQGANTIVCTLSSTATTATLNPTADLAYGYTYTLTVTSGVKDLSGRALSNPGSSTFTVEDDFFENPNGNNTTATAFDLTSGGMGPADIRTVRFYSDALNGLGILKNVDYYKITIAPEDAFKLRIRIYFSDSSGNVQPANGDSLSLYVVNNSQGLGGVQTIVTDLPNDRYYSFDISGRSGDFYIMISETNSNYANLRTYNLWWYAEPGI